MSKKKKKSGSESEEEEEEEEDERGNQKVLARKLIKSYDNDECTFNYYLTLEIFEGNVIIWFKMEWFKNKNPKEVLPSFGSVMFDVDDNVTELKNFIHHF